MLLVLVSFGGSWAEVEMAVRSGQDPGSPEVGWETLCAVVSFGTMWRERRVGTWTKIKTNYTSLHFTASVLPPRGTFHLSR